MAVQIARSLNGATGAAGGYLIPARLLDGLDRRLAEQSLFLRLAQVLPMPTTVAGYWALDLSAAHATGESPLFPGLTLSWTAEGAALPASSPQLTGGQLIARTLTCLVSVSSQVVQGGEDVESYVRDRMAAALAWGIDRACLVGTGAAAPLGILQSPALITVTRASAGEVLASDIAKMAASLLPASYPTAVWLMHPTVARYVASLPTYHLSGDRESERLIGYLLGRPCYVVEHLPAVDSAGCILLADMRMYVVGQRSPVTIDVAPRAVSGADVYLYRAIWMGDGQPIARGRATLADGVTVSSPYVTLSE